MVRKVGKPGECDFKESKEAGDEGVFSNVCHYRCVTLPARYYEPNSILNARPVISTATADEIDRNMIMLILQITKLRF